jgi:hypothetical protein
MGMYDYFFESKHSNKHDSSTLHRRFSAISSISSNTSKKFYMQILKIVLLILNLIFLSLVFIFTTFKHEILSFKSSMNFEWLFVSKPMLKYEPIVLNMLKNGQDSAQYIALNIINGLFNLDFTIVDIFSLLNQHSPLVTATLTMLCLLNIFLLGKNTLNNLIISLNTALVIFNFNFVSQYFKSFLNQRHKVHDAVEGIDFLRYVLIFFPLIEFLLVLDLIVTLEKLLSSPKLVKPKKIYEINNVCNSRLPSNYNPQNLHYTNNANTQTLNQSLCTTENPVQYTLNSNTKNYSLMKYLNSNSPQAKAMLTEPTRKMVKSSSISNNLCSDITTRKAISNISNVIRPAIFSPLAFHGGSTSGKNLTFSH